MYFIADDVHGITADFHAGIVRPGAVRKAETPVMPGTGDNAIIDVAAAQGSSHVRASVVDGEVLLAGTKHGDHFSVHREGAAFTVL